MREFRKKVRDLEVDHKSVEIIHSKNEIHQHLVKNKVFTSSTTIDTEKDQENYQKKGTIMRETKLQIIALRTQDQDQGLKSVEKIDDILNIEKIR